MRRRDLFSKLAAVAAAVTLTPAAKAEAGPDEDAQIRALIDDALAHPDRHPDLWARVRELTGQAPLTFDYAVMVYVENRMLFSVTPEGKISMPDDITDAEMLKAMQLMAGREPFDAIAAARAEGYERRAYIEAMKAESRAMRGLRVGEFHAERITLKNVGGVTRVEPDHIEMLHHDGRRWVPV